MARNKEVMPEKTYVITSAQGIQNPQSARMYGGDESKGAPNKRLIKNIERYVGHVKESNPAELQIHSVVGANCNEVELHPFFNERDDVYVESDSKKRNLQNRKREMAKRAGHEKRVLGWVERETKKAEKGRIAILKSEYGKEWKDHIDDAGNVETPPLVECPFEMPMHYFWEKIPETDWPIIGKRFNSNVYTRSIPVKPQNKHPLTGKEGETKRYGGSSVVIASPKRMMIPVAKGASGRYPHLLITTGSCTHPNYNFGDLGYTAREEHRYGFAVIDVLDDKIFLPRIVPAYKNGNFIDLGIKYTVGKDPVRATVSALDVGDSHFIEINPKIHSANIDMMKHLKPRATFLNDVFAALSVSVHDMTDPIRQARLFRASLSNLEKELELTGKYIAENAKLVNQWGGEICIKWSNHDDMLYRWLANEGYKKDRENQLTAYKILAQDPARENCFETAVRLFYDIPKNVRFLKLGEDVFCEGYLMSAHGHQGSNGGKGNLKSIEKVAKKASIGHGHSCMVWKDSLSVGTSTKIPLDYQRGYFSTSMAGNNLIYETGLAQAVPIVKSKWAPKRVLEFLEKN